MARDLWYEGDGMQESLRQGIKESRLNCLSSSAIAFFSWGDGYFWRLPRGSGEYGEKVNGGGYVEKSLVFFHISVCICRSSSTRES